MNNSNKTNQKQHPYQSKAERENEIAVEAWKEKQRKDALQSVVSQFLANKRLNRHK